MVVAAGAVVVAGAAGVFSAGAVVVAVAAGAVVVAGAAGVFSAGAVVVVVAAGGVVVVVVVVAAAYSWTLRVRAKTLRTKKAKMISLFIVN